MDDSASEARAVAPDARERERLIVENLPLVRALARRFAHRGEPLDDLVQVGTIGLIKAIDRFDPSRGIPLAGFATPTILGEIRRHFRDTTGAVHIPRGVSENRARVGAAVDDLTAREGRAPSVRRIAAETELSEEEVLDALMAGAARRTVPIDGPAEGSDDHPVAQVGSVDEGFEAAEARAVLADGLADLPSRERAIIHMRFHEDLTQSEIAHRVGISQMHVSRLIRRSLEDLRAGAEGAEGNE